MNNDGVCQPSEDATLDTKRLLKELLYFSPSYLPDVEPRTSDADDEVGQVASGPSLGNSEEQLTHTSKV